MSPASQAIHPFALLKRMEIEACLSLGQEALREWKVGWCPAAIFDINCLPADNAMAELPEGQWSAHGMTADAALWCFRGKGFYRQIEHAVFDLGHVSRNNERRAESDIALRVATEAADGLAAALLRRLSAAAAIRLPHADSPPAWHFRRSAGAAWLHIGSGDSLFGILIPNALLPGKSKSALTPVKQAVREPVTPLAGALTGIGTHLYAELGQVEMSLGQLTSLALGDVVTLPVGIDQPLKLFAGKRRLVGQAHLGKQDGYRAVEVFTKDKE